MGIGRCLGLLALVGSLAAGTARAEPRTVNIQGVRKTVGWATATEVLPALDYEGGRPQFPAALERMPFPGGNLLVPVGVTYIDWDEDTPVVNDHGRLEGHLRTAGITRMLFSFPPRLGRSQFFFAKAKDWVVGGLLDDNAIPELPWKTRCIYVLLIPDTRENRAVVGQAAGLGELLHVADGVVEILTAGARISVRPATGAVAPASRPAGAPPDGADKP